MCSAKWSPGPEEPNVGKGVNDSEKTCAQSLRFAHHFLSEGNLLSALLAFDIGLREARQLSLPDKEADALLGEARIFPAIDDGKGYCAAIYLLHRLAGSHPVPFRELANQTWNGIQEQLQPDQLELLQQSADDARQDSVNRADDLSAKNLFYVGPPASEAKRLCGWLLVTPELTAAKLGHGIHEVPSDDRFAHDVALRFFSFRMHMIPEEIKTFACDEIEGTLPEMMSLRTYYRWLAEHLMRTSRYSLAEKACRRAIELESRPDPELHQLLGDIYMDMLDPVRAMREFHSACAMSPEEAIFHACLADALLDINDPDAVCKAKLENEIALKLNPNCAVAHAAKAKLREHEERPQEAMHAYERAIELDPSLAKAHTNLAILHSKSGDLPRAMELFRKALDLDPGNARSIANMGTCFCESGHSDEGIRYYRAAVAADPSFWEVNAMLADTLLELGQYQEAINAYTAALKITGGDPGWHYNMGAAWYSLGEPEKTAAHWRKALEQAPRHTELRPLIAKLERGEKLEESDATLGPSNPSGLTRYEERLVDCPFCKRKFQTRWAVCIDAANNPELRQELATKWFFFNHDICSHCRRPSLTPSTVLYVDRPKDIRILAFREEYSSDPERAQKQYRRKELPSFAGCSDIEKVLDRASGTLEYAWGYDELWETVQVQEARGSGRSLRTIRQALHAIAESRQAGEIESIALSVVGMPEEAPLRSRLSTIIHVGWSKRREQTMALAAIAAIRSAGMEWKSEDEVGFFTEEFRILSSMGRRSEAIEALLRWRAVCKNASTQDMLLPLLLAFEEATKTNIPAFADRIKHELDQMGFKIPKQSQALIEAVKAVNEARPHDAERILLPLLQEPLPSMAQHDLHHALGRCKRQQGDYAAARQHFEKAMDLLPKEWEPYRGSWSAQERMNEYRRLVAQCDIYLGDYERAQRALDLCVAQSRVMSDHGGLGRAYNQLGILATAQRQLGDAHRFYDEARAHYSFAVDSQGAAIAALNDAGVQFNMGQYEKAEKLLVEIGDEIRARASAETRANAALLSSLLLTQRNEYVKAEERLLEALRIAKESGLHHKVATYLEYLSGMARTPQDRLRRCSQAVDELIGVIEKADREPERLALAAQLVGPASEAMAAALECGENEQAWQFAQMMKSPILSDLLTQGVRRRRPAARPVGEGKAAQRLATVASKAAQVGEGETLKEEEDFWEHLYIFREMEKNLTASAARLGLWRAGREPWEKAARPILDSTTAILDFVLRQEDTLIFVLTTEGLHVCHSLRRFGRRDVEQEASALYRAASVLGRPVDPSFVTAQIWKTLIEPVKDVIHGKEKLLLVPHAALALLPIHAARPESATTPSVPTLFDDKTVFYAPSVAVAAACASAHVPQTDRGLVFTFMGYPEPKELVDASRRIAFMMGVKADDIFLGSKCQSTAFLQAIQAKPLRFAHVLCHGSIDAANPARWGLLMADRVITVAEVFASHVDCDLVFLNCCYGSAGALRGPGEVVGMVRSLLQAGARSVISAMWPVHGRVAQEIAEDFYREWKGNGATKARALKKALADRISDLPNSAAFRIDGACD